MPSTHSVIMVALLSIPTKNHNIPHRRLNERPQTNREVLNEPHQWILQPVTCIKHPSAGSGYYNVLGANGNIRRCIPVLAACLANCPECSDLHHLNRHVCFWCVCPKNELGDYVHPDKQHPRRDHYLYRKLSYTNTKAADAELWSRHVHTGLNVYQHMPCIMSDLPNPVLLYTIQISNLDHLQEWIFHFMKTYEGLDMYNAIWVTVPAYHHLTPKK